MTREKRIDIRLMLTKHSLTQVWLINELEKQGIQTDKTELCSALSGTRKGKKAETVLEKSFEILSNLNNEQKGVEPLGKITAV